VARFLTMQEAAGYLSMSRSVVRDHAIELGGVRFGSRWRFPVQALEGWVNARISENQARQDLLRVRWQGPRVSDPGHSPYLPPHHLKCRQRTLVGSGPGTFPTVASLSGVCGIRSFRISMPRIESSKIPIPGSAAVRPPGLRLGISDPPRGVRFGTNVPDGSSVPPLEGFVGGTEIFSVL
jgi:excisionase family DNA binding protein